MPESLLNFTPTVCKLLGIDPPKLAQSAAHQLVLEQAAALPAGGTGNPAVQKLLIYAPDALGRQLMSLYPRITQRIRDEAPTEVELQSVFPSVTPVCFASLFTGAAPGEHGITQYEKKVLSCDTLFDALVRAGKRVALVALENSSMSIIFKGRGQEQRPTPPWQPSEFDAAPRLDYYTVQYDPQVSWCALSLLEHCDYDVIVAYHMQYDDLLHLTEPFSEECLLAYRLHAASFVRLATAADKHWGSFNRAVCVTPDHGAHLNEEKGIGWHGTDKPEDMELTHFWGIKPAS